MASWVALSWLSRRSGAYDLLVLQRPLSIPASASTAPSPALHAITARLQAWQGADVLLASGVVLVHNVTAAAAADGPCVPACVSVLSRGDLLLPSP